ncbi:hypothetical protein FXN61_40885 [Lentzea sp. PSKA42]|uniref:NACHT domain-containing protein n=1 Tax=Lentzea indica TaxID=2604800 RepID=A0ABX1FVX3_9PSEU|nr:hypothetical protein [Lentzea indica]NKE62741.1 hypothetical protein [Lentzea indica]
MEPNEVRNEVHADQVNAPVMQFRDLHGDIHLHAREDTPLRRAARELAAAVRRQWTTEAENRALRQPAPLRVRFSGSHGDVRDVPGMFRGLERRQLVVLGEPGAGKTVAALLLTLELLEHPRDAEPVPILLSATSWDPTTEHLDTWAARRLDEDYPALRNVRAYGKNAAARFVAEGLVMIVVDGLDELPSHLHAAALDGLNRAVGMRPVVVTCRSAEYHAAVTSFGTFLSGAAVVELAPVSSAGVSAYLGEARWTPVITALRRPGPVAEALSSPLMVYLARTIYQAPQTDPAELLRFGTRDDVEQHLVRAYLPAVYERRPQAVGPYRSVRTHAWPLARAFDWLRYLAVRPGQDFEWWHLTAAVPRLLVASIAGLVVFGLYSGVWALYPDAGNNQEVAYFAGLGTCLGAVVRRRPIRPAKFARTRLGREYVPRTLGILGSCVILVVVITIEPEAVGTVTFFLLLSWIIVLSETARHRSDTVTDPDGRALLRNDRKLCLTWLVLGAALYVLLLATIHLRWPPLVAAELVLIMGCAGAAGRTAGSRGG